MPAGKRLALALALAVPAALLGLAAAWARAGRVGAALVLAGATVALVAAALQAIWPRFDLSGRSLRRGAGRSRRVALTFDDGPGDDTPAVLDALDAAGARATFFILGEAARRRPGLVREVARRGHAVGLHGDTHAKLAFASPRRIAAELDRCAAAIRAAGVEPAPLFRAPHGWKGPLLSRALRARGLALVGWSRGVFDTARPGAAVIADRATRRMRPGEILLLHDGCGTPGIDPRRDQTAAAVPEIVRRWREAGYTFVPVGDLEAKRAGDRARPGDGRWAALRRLLAPGDARGARRRRALRWAGLGVVVAFAAWGARGVDVAAVGAVLAGADPAFVALAAGANLLSLAAHTHRWMAVVPPAPSPARFRFRDAFAAIVAGFAVALVVPARAGDLLRAWILARRARLSTASVIAAAGFDYVVGAASLVPLLALLALFTPLPPWAKHALTGVALVAVGGGVAALLLRPRRHGGRAVDAPGTGLLVRLRAGLSAAHDPAALARSLAWGLAGWGAELLIALLVLAALGLPVTVEVGALAVLAASAANAVAVSPGNAGPFELAIVLALTGLGIGREPALAFALLYHLVHLVPVAILGGAVLLREAREAPERALGAAPSVTRDGAPGP